VICGDAMLLAIEAADCIRAAARIAGYTEREVFIAEQHFKWVELRQSTHSLSLFADRKMIDLRIPTGKPGIEGGQALQDYVEHLSPDILTLITLPKLDSTTQKSKWFTALQRQGIVIAANDISRTELPLWLATRLNRQHQSTDALTLEFLTDCCEGNLLAAYQEIQKLALLFPAGVLTHEQIKSAVVDVARYDIFKLSDAMLNGNADRFVRILDGLKNEDASTVLILWAMSEEIRKLGKVLQAIQCGANLNTAMRDARVWGAQCQLIENAARRIKLPLIKNAIRHAALLDKIIKGLRQGDIWDELLQLGLRFSITS
jgi:DNA polymerase-3 subunit delta